MRADGRTARLEGRLQDGVLIVSVPGRAPIRLGGGLIVRTDDPAGVDAARMRALGLRMVRHMRGMEHTWLLRAADAPAALAACRSLSATPGVRWAVPDFQLPVDLYHRPDDPLYPDQWHLAQASGQDIAAELAWDLSTGTAEVVVAVVDTGVDPHHPDLAPSRMVAPHNVVTGSDDPSPSDLAIDAHGTACAGLAVASGDNRLGVSGVCPGCSWMPVRVFERGARMNLAALSDGIGWAVDQGAWVISCSWGVPQELIDQGVDITPVREAVQRAVSEGRAGKGCVVVFASGNGDQNRVAQPVGPDELPAMEETLAVGGCDHTGTVATYSDYGACLSVVAPTWSGTDGDPKVITTDVAGSTGYNQEGEYVRGDPEQGDVPTGEPEPDAQGDYTAHFTGTSAAAPVAAGVAALVLAIDPELTWARCIAILQQTAGKVGTDAADPALRAVYDADGHHPRYGHGRVDAGRAAAVALYGTGAVDGSPCLIDLNCLGDCVVPETGEDGAVCATACTATEECAEGSACLDGHCFTTEEQDDPEPNVAIVGGCGCGGMDGADRLGLAWLLLFDILRRRLKLYPGEGEGSTEP